MSNIFMLRGSMREIVFDTETTGLSPLQGHRVVEIGCVETVNHVATGTTLHLYLNPERDMPEEASRVHGLTSDFLADKPVFSEVVDQFMAFVKDSPLVAHNASFDMAFLNAEMIRLGFPALTNKVVDTLEIARKRFFGAPASLDALCSRFDIDTSARSLHGALLDAELLAEVYLELCGGRQPGLEIGIEKKVETADSQTEVRRVFREPRPHTPTEEELAAHEAFIGKIKGAVWKRI